MASGEPPGGVLERPEDQTSAIADDISAARLGLGVLAIVLTRFLTASDVELAGTMNLLCSTRWCCASQSGITLLLTR